MLRNFPVLGAKRLQPCVTYCQPTQKLSERVTPNDPAVEVMTDFSRVNAVIVGLHDTIDEANRRMIEHGVRLLLAVDQKREVLGIITATDVLGERPIQIVSERGCRHDEVLVQDVMTPCSHLEALEFSDVVAAKVGHIVSTLKAAGRQHTLVVETATSGYKLCGVFSATQIARQLGAPIHTNEIARTFFEIETLLAR